MNPIVPVILCGGSGTRLWPRSRPDRPKPFLDLVGGRTLFQASLDRCARADLFRPPVVVAGSAHAELIEAQLPAENAATLIIEPAARNTAPAIALAAALLDPADIMLVCPSDQHIADEAAFHDAVATAADLARADWLVSFGIVPTRPETGFGYVRRGEPLEQGGYKVDAFVEKPDLERAKSFLAQGGFDWNGGIFCMRAGKLVEELARYRPDMADAVRASADAARKDGRTVHPDAAAFTAIEPESIDYAVMENTQRAAMVPVSMGWSDIGNWHALREARAPHEADARGNIVRGAGELVDCERVMTDTDGPRISVIGLSDVTVIVDGDEVLVLGPGGEQQVGKLKGAQGQ